VDPGHLTSGGRHLGCTFACGREQSSADSHGPPVDLPDGPVEPPAKQWQEQTHLQIAVGAEQKVKLLLCCNGDRISTTTRPNTNQPPSKRLVAGSIPAGGAFAHLWRTA
jgi:hypothetical protein